MGRVTTRARRVRFVLAPDRIDVIDRPDTIAVEEPLSIRVANEPVTMTMRTPGDDFDLALGHLFTEGLIVGPDDVAAMMHCTDVDADGAPTFNVVDVTLAPGVHLSRRPDVRAETATSACGVCGRRSVDDLLERVGAVVADGFSVDPRAVPTWLATLRSAQRTFDRTGGVHAAALLAPDGSLLAVREDVGRHNAVDKVVGAGLRAGLDIPNTALVVTSRAGFEIVAKAAAAGVPVVVAAGAPTSLAVELAERCGITLVAFARERSLAAYAHPHRIDVGDTGR